jgi:hypothetical protein
MKKILLVLTLLMTISLSCRKNSDDASNIFPIETQEGRNTFGCYVNGSAFIAGTTLFGLVSPVNVSYYQDSAQYYQAGFLSINGIDARYSLDVAGDIVINKLKVFGVGEYNLQHAGGNCASTYSCDDIGYRNATTGRIYYAESGKLIVTKLDTVSKIVSGKFNFIAKDTLGNRIEVTDGRFDARYSN